MQTFCWLMINQHGFSYGSILKDLGQRLVTARSGIEALQWLMERQLSSPTRLVNDLLDISRITSGKITFKKEIVDIATVIARATEMVQPFILNVDTVSPSSGQSNNCMSLVISRV